VTATSKSVPPKDGSADTNRQADIAIREFEKALHEVQAEFTKYQNSRIHQNKMSALVIGAMVKRR